MPTTNTPIDQLASMRSAAEGRLATLKRFTDALRAEHAAAVLSAAFPQHTLAVFTRNWDEDEPHLLQLITSVEGVEDIEVADQLSTMSSEQKSAVNTAETAIVLIGSDDDIHEHLDEPDEQSNDWVEFDLSLSGSSH